MKTFLWITLAFSLISPAVQAEPRKNVRVELQIVAIPEELAVPLVPDLMNKDKIEDAYARIQVLLTKGVAKLIGWPMVTVHSGERAEVQSISEFHYLTDVEPPGVDIAPDLKNEEEPHKNTKVDVTVFDAVPRSFEVRNLGLTLGVEPTLSDDGNTISLTIEPQHVRLKAMNKIALETDHGKPEVVVEQPEFDTMKTTTSLTLRNGERTLLGIYRANEPAKHIEFFILKAQALPME